MTEFISRKYGNDGYEVIIKTDSHEHYKAAEEFARRLIDHAKPMTNGDRIRAMSDGELAKVIDNIRICNVRTLQECREIYCGKCESCILAWLKQGVE